MSTKPIKRPDVLTLCRKIVLVADEDLAELESMAQEQADYIHPLKNATAARMRALGKHNLTVLAKLRGLRDAIKEGESLSKRGAA